LLNRDRYDEARHSSCRRDMIIIEQKVSGFNMFRVLAPTAERTVASGSPSRKSRTEPHDGGRLRRLPRPRFSAATKLTATHTPRVPLVSLDGTVLRAAAEAFASGEIDRTELMRRITRVK
jgi:hypothetical protein